MTGFLTPGQLLTGLLQRPQQTAGGVRQERLALDLAAGQLPAPASPLPQALLTAVSSFLGPLLVSKLPSVGSKGRG